jgi:hypothetical protein
VPVPGMGVSVIVTVKTPKPEIGVIQENIFYMKIFPTPYNFLTFVIRHFIMMISLDRDFYIRGLHKGAYNSLCPADRSC